MNQGWFIRKVFLLFISFLQDCQNLIVWVEFEANFLPQACFLQSFREMIKRFLLISLRKSHCFSSERRSRMFCLVLKNCKNLCGMNMKIKRLSYLCMRGEFCHSTKLVLKLLPLKTSLCICTAMACVLCVGPIDRHSVQR